MSTNGPGHLLDRVPAPSSGVRLTGIEGLRALAASAIVVTHVWGFSTPGGAIGARTWIGDLFSMLSVGVTLFFTLSGFLLYRPFAAAIVRGEAAMPLRSYFRNRLLRIAPAYWVILAATALLLGAVYVRDESGALQLGRLTAGPFVQAALLLQDYRPSTLLNGIAPAWSLAVEIVFYAVLPLLVLGATCAARYVANRRQRVLVLLGPPLLLLLVGLSGKYATHLSPGSPRDGFNADWHSVLERSFWTQADLFSFGMVVAVVHTEVADGLLRLSSRGRRLMAALGILIFLPCALTMQQGELSYLPQNTGQALAIALLFAAVILPHPTGGANRVLRWLEQPWLIAVGVASYSLFLWHYPIILWMTAQGLTFAGWGGLLVNLVVIALVVGLLSALTYRFVERPALRLKQRAPKPRQAERPVIRQAGAAPLP